MPTSPTISSANVIHTSPINRRTRRRPPTFDSPRGRYYYRRRLGTVEPVFANIRSTLGLDHFTLRGQKKVDTQWKLSCLVHNIGKLSRYGPSFQAPTRSLRRNQAGHNGDQTVEPFTGAWQPQSRPRTCRFSPFRSLEPVSKSGFSTGITMSSAAGCGLSVSEGLAHLLRAKPGSKCAKGPVAANRFVKPPLISLGLPFDTLKEIRSVT